MKQITKLLVLAVILGAFASCTVTSNSMKGPNNYVEFQKEDFEFSAQVTGEASATKIFGIDWARLFSKKVGEVHEAGAIQIPIIGTMVAKGTNLYALYNMMQANPGYDVVFYPQFHSKTTGVPILFTNTKTKVTARLAKIKK